MVKILPTYPGIKLQGSMFAMYSGNKHTNKNFNTCSLQTSISGTLRKISLFFLLTFSIFLRPSAEIDRLLFKQNISDKKDRISHLKEYRCES